MPLSPKSRKKLFILGLIGLAGVILTRSGFDPESFKKHRQEVEEAMERSRAAFKEGQATHEQTESDLTFLTAYRRALTNGTATDQDTKNCKSTQEKLITRLRELEGSGDPAKQIFARKYEDTMAGMNFCPTREEYSRWGSKAFQSRAP